MKATGTNGIFGALGFAIGGVIILISFGLLQLTFNNTYANFDWLGLGSVLAFGGFVLLAMGLWLIINDAITATKQNPS